MDTKSNSLNWFEIPVADFTRAKKFYETIFNIEMPEMEMQGTKMGMFPYETGSGKAAGAICHGTTYKPSKEGVTIYLNGNPDLSNALNKVEKAGGKVVMPKTQIAPDIGYMAFIEDSEGNKVALHSQG